MRQEPESEAAAEPKIQRRPQPRTTGATGFKPLGGMQPRSHNFSIS